MPREDPDSASADHGYTVHLTERRDDWSIAVTRAGRAAAFEVYHRDAQSALAMAKALAATEGADLVVLTVAGRGYEFVPAARVSSYVLPIRRHVADRRRCG
jgi:hypothetical protein